MPSAFWVLVHLALTFSVATFILRQWKLLKLLIPLAVTSLWPVIFIGIALSSDPPRTLSDGITIFAYVLNPIVQAWFYRFVQSKLSRPA